jgi:hypothetical protein
VAGVEPKSSLGTLVLGFPATKTRFRFYLIVPLRHGPALSPRGDGRLSTSLTLYTFLLPFPPYLQPTPAQPWISALPVYYAFQHSSPLNGSRVTGNNLGKVTSLAFSMLCQLIYIINAV